jgi:Mce-associated membrane protein
MPTEHDGTLKLIKGGQPTEPSRTVRRRSATRRAVTRRTPVSHPALDPVPDPVTAVLERLDEEPAEPIETAGPAKPRRAARSKAAAKTDTEADVAADADVDADADADADADVDADSRESDEADEEPDAPAVPKHGRTTPRRRRTAPRRESARVGSTRITVALLAVLCVALAAAAVFGSRWYGDRELDRAHQQALAAAKQTTVDFVSVSAVSVDSDLQRILAGSTGDFKEEFSRGQAQVRTAIVENNVESRGTVLRAALMSGDRRHAVVLVAMDATVRNTNAPDGRASHYRIQVEVNRDPDSGRWLVSRLQFVG